jgi:acid stress-induced BolA-like protein IbaG/YrbA
MAQTIKTPSFVQALSRALKKAIPSAKVEFERVPRTNRYRLAVVASRFNRMHPLRRQHLIWDIVEEVLEPKDMLKVSMIVAISTVEANAVKAK